MRALVSALVSALLISAQLPLARAQGGTDETPEPSAEAQALAFMETGTARYRDGDFASALRAFEQAAALVPERANPYRWLGLTLVRLDRCPDAVVALNRFLSLVPRSDTRIVEAETLRDRCRSELVPKLGTLIIDSTPPGAEVRLGGARGVALGKTPLREDSILVGSHVVYLHAAGHKDVLREVQLERNETVRLNVDLPPLPPPAPRRTGLVVGLTVGAIAVVALGLGLGLGLGLRSSPEVLPPIIAPLVVR